MFFEVRVADKHEVQIWSPVSLKCAKALLTYLSIFRGVVFCSRKCET